MQRKLIYKTFDNSNNPILYKGKVEEWDLKGYLDPTNEEFFKIVSGPIGRGKTTLTIGIVRNLLKELEKEEGFPYVPGTNTIKGTTI